MPQKFGPTKSDVQFRLAFAVVGLAVLGGALVFRGLPTGPGGWEAIGIAGIFFGGTFVWCIRKLIRKDYSDGL